MTMNVVACLDQSDLTGRIANAAAWVSSKIRVPLNLVHVLEKADANSFPGTAAQGPQTEEEGLAFLDSVEATLNETFFGTVQKQVKDANLVDVIGDLYDETRVLVIGKRGKSSAPGQLGNSLTDLIRASQRPTLIVTGSFVRPTNAMLAFNGSETSMKAVMTIAKSPLFEDMECHVVMVGAETEEHKKQLDWAASTLKLGGVSTQAHLLAERDVAKTLSAYAKSNGIQMMVMGAYSHTQLRRLMLGSATRMILEETRMPLLILR